MGLQRDEREAEEKSIPAIHYAYRCNRPASVKMLQGNRTREMVYMEQVMASYWKFCPRIALYKQQVAIINDRRKKVRQNSVFQNIYFQHPI